MLRELLLLLTTAFITLTAQTVPQTCDGPLPSSTAPCAAVHDVVISFDASMKQPGQDTAMDNLLRTLVGAYTLVGNGPRVGLVAYSNTATLVQPLTSTAATLTSAIDNREPSSGHTCTVCGLQRAQEELAANSRSGARKVLILLSDGRGTLHGGDPAAIATANQIRAAGTRIIAVGLSTSVSTDTIESMASEPTAAFSYIYSSIASAQSVKAV